MLFKRPFPLKVIPYDDESLLGIVGRLMERNGYHRQVPLWQFLGLTKGAMADDTIENLAALSRIPAEKLQSLFSRAVSDGFVQILGKQLSSSKIAAAPALCLHCFGEAAYHRAIWDIKWYRACPRHGCLLHGKCPECDQPLVWERQKLVECSSGHSLTDVGHQAKKAAWQLSAEMAIEEMLEFGEVRSHALPDVIRALPLDAFIDVLNVLGGFGKRHYSELSRIVGPNTFARASRRLNKGFEQAVEWPMSLHRYVQHQTSRPGNSGHGSIRFLRGEIRRLEGTPAGELLANEWTHEFPQMDDVDIIVSDPAIEADDEISLFEIAAEMGYSRREISLINKVDRLAKRERRTYFTGSILRREKYEEWKREGRAWLQLKQVATRWKVDRRSLGEACRLGLLGFDISDAISDQPVDPWRIRQGEVDALEKLLSTAPSAVETEGRRLSELGISLSSAIRSIRKGTLVACGWTPAQGFGAARFAKLGAEGAIASQPEPSDLPLSENPSPSPSGALVPLSQLADEMKLELSVIERACRDGFLGNVRRGGKSVDAADAAKFLANFVSSLLLHEELAGPTLDQIYRAIKRNRIQPASRPIQSFRGGSWHRSQFFRRSDLQDLKFN